MFLRVLITAFMIFGATGAYGQTYSADQQSAKQAGIGSANAALSVIGTQPGITTNIANPIAGGTQMTTLDGKKSFNGQATCPSSKSFLAVTILPSSSGDLSSVIVQEDTALSGQFNYAYQVPIRVSGICANGIISCNAGSWNNCSYYQWAADANSRVSLAQVPSIEQLAGCYCINNSCGVSVMTTLNLILRDLGTAVANAMQGNDPQYIITGSNVQDTTISYYGQQSSNCQMASLGSSGQTSNLAQYYSNPTLMENGAQSVVSGQQSDPNSYYNLMQQVNKNTEGPQSTAQCAITNNAVLTTTPVPTTNPIGYTFYATADASLIMNLDGVQIMDTSSGGSGGWANTSTAVQSILPGTHTVDITGTGSGVTFGLLFALQNNGDGSWPVISSSGSFQNACFDFGSSSPHPLPSGWPETTAHWIWGCTGSPSTVSATFTASLLIYQDTMNNSVITDNCTNYENSSTCRLKDEIVDNVQTYQNYNPTGLTPLPSCRDFTGKTQVFNVCHNWWTKTRTYVCSGGNSFDFTDIQKRVTSINASAKDGGSALTYTDTTADSSGNWSVSNNSIALTPRDASACPKACKIKRPITDTQAGTAGNASEYQASSGSFTWVYAQCNNGSPCPTQPGDIVAIDCQCINEFAEAATILSVLNSAGKDLICSSGTFQ